VMKSIQKIWVAIIILLLFTQLTHASMNRPGVDEGKPTEIRVLGAILDVDKINSAEQNFTLNLYTIFRWTDVRLAHDGEDSVTRKLSDVWNPRLTIMNTQRLWANTKDDVEVSPEGEVTYRLHVFGDFSQPLDLHEFPTDRHTFEVPVVAAGYRSGEVVFSHMKEAGSFMAERLSVADWVVSNMQSIPAEVELANGIKLPGFSFSFEGQRLVHHYVVKAILPLVLIVMMSWVVFWIDPKQIPNQLSVAVTTVLTLIAYHIALSGRLPVIPYLTRMDKFLFSSTLLVFLSLIEVVITSHFSSTNRLKIARRIDKTARWFFPLLFILTTAASFSL
jgi:hypothetical protein